MMEGGREGGREGEGTYRSASRLSAYKRTTTSITIYNKLYRNDGWREGGREGPTVDTTVYYHQTNIGIGYGRTIQSFVMAAMCILLSKIYKEVFNVKGQLGVMVFNATFNYSSVISWRSVLTVEETRVPGKNHRSVASH